jgi:hypothetical protein
MQCNRLSAFTLGVIITATSVGAVTYVNAAGDATLKACANKKTGAMRYISKGSCKKTEKSLSWNQMGPQGTPGSAGVAGTNGQNFHVIDATGRDLGPTLGLWNQGQTASILFDGGLWEIYSYDNFPRGVFSPNRFYSDNSCVTPLAEVNEKIHSMARGWNGDEENPKFWKLAGSPFRFSSKVIYGKVQGAGPPYTFSCTPSSDSRFYGQFFEGAGQDPFLSVVTEVTPPAYTAPFTIVAK